MKLQSDKRCDPRLSARSCRLGRKLMDDADERLFRRIMNNSEHVLQPFLPGRPVLSYNLRRRPHCNKSLITKTVDLCNYHSSNLQRQPLTLLLTKQSHHCTLSCFTQFVVTRLILYGPNRAENLKTVALAVPKIFHGV